LPIEAESIVDGDGVRSCCDAWAFLARGFFSFTSVLDAAFLCVVVVRGFAAPGDLGCLARGDLAAAAVTVFVPESDKAPP
jgi:hypothetical protein